MEESGDSGARRPAYWLIAKRENGREAEVLTVGVGAEEALAVFSFEEEARLFLLFEDPGAGWRVKETAAGEMTHALFGPRARARRVVLDPLPAVLGQEANLLVSLESEEFARRLYAGQGAGSSGRPHRRCPGGTPSARGARGGRGSSP